MNKDEQILTALRAINVSQKHLWNLHHLVKEHDEKLAMQVWEQTLQIEHALLELNEALYGKREYFERDSEGDLGELWGTMTKT